MKYKRISHYIWKLLPQYMRPWLMYRLLSVFAKKAQNISCNPDSPLYVVGYFSATTGLGESARLYWHEMRKKRNKIYAVDVTRELFQESVPGIWDHASLTPNEANRHAGTGEIVFHINPATILLAIIRLRHLCQNKRIVGYWAWELEDIPMYWVHCLAYVDAVEVPSDFIAGAISRYTNKPVLIHHHNVLDVTPSTRAFGEDGVVRCLFIFDTASNFCRKNPLAAVRAFQRAFGDDPCFELILKAGSLERYPEGKRALLRLTDGQKNIRIIQERIPAEKLDAIYRLSDIYLSLHRSEGYGLTIHEAMKYGLHVLATGWSGNMSFMRDQHKCHPLPYTLVPVVDPQANYFIPNQRWAETSVDIAAHKLREIAAEGRPEWKLPKPSAKFCPLAAEHIAVVIVNYRSARSTLECINKLEQLERPPRHTIVVDNGSEDNSVATLLSQWPNGAAPTLYNPSTPLPPRCIIPLEKNRGFAAGNNAALHILRNQAEVNGIWLLNPDTLPEASSLDALCQRLESVPEAGACGSTLLRRQTMRVQCAAGAHLNKLTGETQFLAEEMTLEQLSSISPETIEKQLDELVGASMLLRQSCLIEIGLMPEEYFLYREDSDWSMAMQRAGWKLAWAPHSIVIHEEGATTSVGKRVPAEMDYLLLRNRIFFMRRYFPYRTCFVMLRFIPTLVARCLRNDFAGAKRCMRAIIDGVWGLKFERKEAHLSTATNK